MTTDHMDIETLSAFSDGDLTAVNALRVERHLAECDECRHSLERVRALVASAHILPREIAPPPEVWAKVRSRKPRAESREPRWWHNGWLAAAAGFVLVVGTASLTFIAGANNRAKTDSIASIAAAATPVVLANVEKNYAPTLAQLRETLETQRSLLAPTTVRALENSLAVIDSAIAEARTALEADPNSGALVDLLSMSYQRKVEFLRRATTLSSSL